MAQRDPWTPRYTHHTPRPRISFTAVTSAIITVLIAIAVITLMWWRGLIAVGLPTFPDPPIPSPTLQSAPYTPPADEPQPAPSPTQSRATVGQPVEGFDYSFMRIHNGGPVKWACDAPITLATRGLVPPGTQQALTNALRTLTQASALPLILVEPDSDADITIYYAPLGATREHITLDDDNILGRGGPQYSADEIIAGTAVIRNDTPRTDPTTLTGETVLIHELAHTLGLNHADPDSGQLMVPKLATDPPTLGAGDRIGLQHLGC